MGKGKLELITDKPCYTAGEYLTGTVCLEVHKPISCKSIVISLKGNEKATYFDWFLNSYHFVHRWNTPIDENVDVLDPFGNNQEETSTLIQPGKYSYPFEFLLPIDLPGSCKLLHGTAVIKYKLKVKACVEGLLTTDMREAKEIKIRALPTYTSTNLLMSKNKKLRFMGMFDKGLCTLSAELKNGIHFFYQHETITLSVTVNNKSWVKISDIKCELVQRIAIVDSEPVNKRFGKKKYVGVDVHQSLNDYTIDFPLVNLGKKLHSSVSTSTVVSCAYDLRVTCGVFMCPDLKIDIPIEILASPPDNSNSLPCATTVDKPIDNGSVVPSVLYVAQE